MREKRVFLIFSVVVLIAASGASAAKTAIDLRSSPPGASVTLFRSSNTGYELYARTTTDSVYVIRDTRSFFGPERSSLEMWAVYILDGYKPAAERFRVAKGQTQIVNADLEALNTRIEIAVDPPGAQIAFFETVEEARVSTTSGTLAVPIRDLEASVDFETGDVLQLEDGEPLLSPPGVRSTSAPTVILMTESEARAIQTPGVAIRVSREGFIQKAASLDIFPRRKSLQEVTLRPLEASLTVISDLKGIEVEDVRPGTGFGYLGETPFTREFNARDCIRGEDEWKQAQKVFLKIHASKPGYRDRVVDVEIPWGEESTVNVSLRPRSTQVNFQSDPPEVHVYHIRTPSEWVYNEETRESEKVVVRYEKHLGVTPFTYYMDPEDPLEHDDLLLFRKSGYADSALKFAAGMNNYHSVLTPLELMRQE